MGACCSSEEDGDERQRLINDDRNSNSKQQQQRRRPASQHSTKNTANNNSSTTKTAPMATEHRRNALHVDHHHADHNRGSTAATDSQKAAAGVNGASKPLNAVDEQQKMKQIIAKAERQFIDLQDVALSMQPPSLEDSRFFAHLESAKVVRSTNQPLFSLPTVSNAGKDTTISQRLAAPNPLDTSELKLGENIDAIRKAIGNAKITPKGELIAFFAN